MGDKKSINWKLRKIGAGLLIAIVIIAGWQLIALFAGKPSLFPTWQYLYKKSLPEFALFGDYNVANVRGAVIVIFIHLATTLKRIIVGFFLGIFLGMCSGIAISWSKRFENSLTSLLSVLRYVPLLGIIPLFLNWFGESELGIYLYITFSVFVISATDTFFAVKNIPRLYRTNGRLLGAGIKSELTTIVLPAIMPELIADIRNLTGLVWAFSLGAEYLAANRGLGYLAYQCYQFSDMGKLIIIIGIYVILATGTYLLLSTFLRKQTRWLNRFN